MENDMKLVKRQWKKKLPRNQEERRIKKEMKISALKSKSLSRDVEEANISDSMDADLYTSAMNGEILEFVKAVEKGPADWQLDMPAACIQVSPQKNTALHVATSFRNYEIVNIICKDLPFFVPEKNCKGDTALHIAARNGDVLIVGLIIDALKSGRGAFEAGLGAINCEGNTALHEALRHRHEKVAGILIDKDQDASYSVNDEGKSVLYLAAEAGYVNLVRVMMENPLGNHTSKGKSWDKSPVYAAIHGRNINVLKFMWEADQFSFQLRCEDGRNPLHYASVSGYLEGVTFLLEKCCGFAYQRDKNGNFPIHLASETGRIDIIQEFLLGCPDSRELLNRKGENILHVASKNGNGQAVQFLMNATMIDRLVNEKDNNGNTPLHLATIHHHPKVVFTLTQDHRVILMPKNKEGLTPADLACEYYSDMDRATSFKEKLTWLVLRVSCARRYQVNVPRSRRQNSTQRVLKKLEHDKENVTLFLWISIFIATVTFSAGFTIPGGDNNSNPNQGFATMVREKMFHVFVISNTIALYTSVMVAVSLIWGQLVDLGLVPFALKLASPILGVALSTMAMAFMAGLYLVVSKLIWLGFAVLFMGFVFFVTLSMLIVPLCFLGSSNYYILRYVSYYPLRLMLLMLGSNSDD